MEKIKLEYPIISDGKKLEAITMRRPKVRDQLLADKASGQDAEKEVALFANLCELPPDAIEDLDMVDYQTIQGTYSGFLSSRQKSAAKAAS